MGNRGSSQAGNGSPPTAGARRRRRPEHRLAIVVHLLVLTACTSTASPPSTDPAPVVPAPVLVPEATSPSTQPEVAESVDLCPRGIAWEVGRSYVADCFLVPVRFAPTIDGWRSRGVGAEWIEATWIDPEVSGSTLNFVLLAYEPTRATEEVMAMILDIDGVQGTSEAQPALVAGRTGKRIDVSTDPAPANDSSQGRRGGCSNSYDRAVDLYFTGPGYILLDRIGSSGGSVYGLGACFAFRIWVIEVDGFALTLIVAATHPDQLEAAASAVMSLFDTAVLGSS